MDLAVPYMTWWLNMGLGSYIDHVTGFATVLWNLIASVVFAIAWLEYNFTHSCIIDEVVKKCDSDTYDDDSH